MKNERIKTVANYLFNNFEIFFGRYARVGGLWHVYAYKILLTPLAEPV